MLPKLAPDLKMKSRLNYLLFLLGLTLCLIPACLNINSSVLTQSSVNQSPMSQALTQSALGTNPSGIANWSTEMPFVDAFKMAKQWLTQCVATDPGCSGAWDTKEYEKLDLDANGWVKSLPAAEDPPEYTRVATVLFRSVEPYPGGRYVVLYNGEGTIEYGFDARYDRAASRPGRDVINVTPSKSGIHLTITATDPNQTGDYIRDIRVVPEESEDSYQQQLFNPEFLAQTEPFQTVRFMGWLATNSSQQSDWDERPTVESYSYSQTLGGVPLETMIELSNRLEADPWFNIPHRASDRFIENFARLVKDTLNPNLTVYLEYSNEIWNTNFSQGSWVEKQGVAEWSDRKGDDFTKRINWHGKRTAQSCDIWKAVFGEQRDRVICVMGAHAANLWTAEEALDCPLWEDGPCQQHGIEAVAIAPYFGGYIGKRDYERYVQDWTLEQLFEEINQGGVLPDSPTGGAVGQAVERMKTYAALADRRNLQLFAYEGGQHLSGRQGVENNDKITHLFISANRSPKMYETYLDYLEQWQNSGGTLFLHAADITRPDKWGSWGALEHVKQKNSPKFDALLDFFQSDS